VSAPGTGLDVVYDFEGGGDPIEARGFGAADICIVAYGTTDTEILSIGGDRIA
jgi:hypothetical protein